jgi:hypothetical protein
VWCSDSELKSLDLSVHIAPSAVCGSRFVKIVEESKDDDDRGVDVEHRRGVV